MRYTVTAEVRSRDISRERHLETRTYLLEPNGAGGWRIRPPAPPPYVFASGADANTLHALLDPSDSPYVSASAFAWQLLRGAGWEIPYADIAALPHSPGLAAVRTAQVGDLAIYYDGQQPYHVGVVESDDRVVSATLNGGIRRTPFAAFAGEIRYRRPVPIAIGTPAPEPLADGDPGVPPSAEQQPAPAQAEVGGEMPAHPHRTAAASQVTPTTPAAARQPNPKTRRRRAHIADR